MMHGQKKHKKRTSLCDCVCVCLCLGVGVDFCLKTRHDEYSF